MPTPLAALPFTTPFTAADVRAAGLSSQSLAGWRKRDEIVIVGRGVFAPSTLTDLERARRIHINRMITSGAHPVSFEGAAILHSLCTPTALPPRHKVPIRRRDLPCDLLERHGRLLVPTRVLTVFELARWQSVPQALIPLECWLRNFPTPEERDTLQQLIDATAGWPGTRHIPDALALASRASASALESCSRGLIVQAGLPMPAQQVEFRVESRRYFVDFLWADRRIIGEADGEAKYDPGGKAQFAQHRRQADLQSLGYTVVRWGWPELLPDPRPWLNGLRQIINARR